MPKLTKTTQTTEQTKNLGELLGEEVRYFSGSVKHAFCIALSGELGAGKTLFTQGLAKGLGIRARIQSPTFVFMKRYSLKSSTFDNMWHMDCYRIEKDTELGPLEFKEIASDPKNILVIEWAERIRKHIPKDALWITLEHQTPESRIVTFAHEKR